MRIFETHAHLDFPEFNQDRDKILNKCFQNGIEYLINIGTEEASSRASIQLAEKYPQIYAAVGYHPHDALRYQEELIRKLAGHKKVVAIGEIGLDFYRNRSPRDVQLRVFAEQLELARELSLPVVIHDREAHDECWEILQNNSPEKVVFHCFSGDKILADKIIDQGWKLSFTGTVTYKNSLQQDIVRFLPEDGFMVETDCPFLSPVPQRGKRNDPANLRHIIEKIAELRGTTPNKIAEITFANACDFFFASERP